MSSHRNCMNFGFLGWILLHCSMHVNKSVTELYTGNCRMQTTRGRARNIGVTGRLNYRFSSDVYLRLDSRSFLRRERSRDPGRLAQGKVGPGARIQTAIR